MDKLYLTAKEAAKPPPYLLVGKEKRPQRKALEAYFESRQEVRSGS